MNEAARCWNTARPLTHPLATTREGLALEATQRPTCDVEGCQNTVHRAGLVCGTHRTRMKKYGSYDGGRPFAGETVRFERYVKRTDTCWLWTGAHNNAGYGQFYVRARRGSVLAHRWSYEHHNGPIDDGLFVMHSCDNPPCVNPDHLGLGTNQDNIDDKTAKGRGLTPTCKQGHEWTDSNTITFTKPSGAQGRRCRQCTRDRERRQVLHG